MDLRLGNLNTKIEKLLHQKQKIEEAYINSIAKVISDSIRKGADIQALAGLVLDASEIIKESSVKAEAWQIAGQKFLSRSKTRRLKAKAAKDQSISHSL